MNRQTIKGMGGLFALILLTVTSAAVAKPAATVVSTIGGVEITLAKTGETVTLDPTDTVAVDDVIKTRADGQVKLLMADDSLLLVGALTTMKIDQSLIGDDKNETVIDVSKGWLRSMIGRKLNAKSKYEVQSPVAVAGVRGTDFVVLVADEENTAVRCSEGKVEVRNRDKGVVGSVLITPNTYTVVRGKKPPAAAKDISPGESLSDKIKSDKDLPEESSADETPAATGSLPEQAQGVAKGLDKKSLESGEVELIGTDGALGSSTALEKAADQAISNATKRADSKETKAVERAKKMIDTTGDTKGTGDAQRKLFKEPAKRDKSGGQSVGGGKKDKDVGGGSSGGAGNSGNVPPGQDK